MQTLYRLLGFDPTKHNLRTELMAGLTTFLTMSYILAVNPDILSSTGMDKGAVFTATALASALGTVLIAFLAKLPFAQAPGMGINAFFAFTLVAGMGLQLADGARRCLCRGRYLHLAHRFQRARADRPLHSENAALCHLGRHRIFHRLHRIEKLGHHCEKPRHPRCARSLHARFHSRRGGHRAQRRPDETARARCAVL